MKVHSCIHPLPCTPSTGILVSGGRTEAKLAANTRKLYSLTVNSSNYAPFHYKDLKFSRSSSMDFSRMAIGSVFPKASSFPPFSFLVKLHHYLRIVLDFAVVEVIVVAFCWSSEGIIVNWTPIFYLNFTQEPVS